MCYLEEYYVKDDGEKKYLDVTVKGMLMKSGWRINPWNLVAFRLRHKSKFLHYNDFRINLTGLFK